MHLKKDKYSHRVKIDKLFDLSNGERKTKCISIGPIENRISEPKHSKGLHNENT